MSRPISYIGSRLPRGWPDLWLQLALFFCAYEGYQFVRGLSEAKEDLAMANAERIIGLERSLGLFVEGHVQAFALGSTWLIDGANFMYVNSHFVITTSFLVWLYLTRNDHFYFVRNMFMVAMLIALTGYLLYPTAPPRLVLDSGLVDSLAAIGHLNTDSNTVGLLVNKYAAVPSMHIGFATMIGVTASRLVRPKPLQVLWLLYPFVVLFVVMSTGNHFWFDGAVGAAVAGLSALIASRVLAPVRPEQWAFDEAAA